MSKKLLLCSVFLLATYWGKAQEKCASHIYEQQLRQMYPESYGTVEDFENWLKNLMGNGYLSKRVVSKDPNNRTGGGPYQIKVIIHVIHDGSPIANGSQNIPYAQAISQIRVLNEDYQRLNADASQTRSIFQSVAGAFPDIEFVPATHDPNGNPLPEPGVRRINGLATFGISAWQGPGPTSNTENILKPNTIWDPTKYLNIWCVNFSSSGLFGYAQFPQGSGLPGMPTGTLASNKDGVVISYKAFGSNYKADGTLDPAGPFITNPIAPGADRGRTATHEIGHWLGLRHTWGDGNCLFDDYCRDTPWQVSGSPLTSICVASHGRNTCSTVDEPWGKDMPDQIENYMDYSADVCMNMFTQEQVNRMRIVLLNSPRRKELIGNTIFSIFTANFVGGNPGLTVNFDDKSGVTGTEPAITQWIWNFDADGLGGVSLPTYTATTPATADPPPITFNNLGTYRVTLTVTNGFKTDVSEMFIHVYLPPFNAPTNLVVTNQQGNAPDFFVNDKVDLEWDDNSNDEDEFIVLRRKTDQSVATFKVIGTLPPNSTTFTDNSEELEDGVSYTYLVLGRRGTETKESNSRSILFKRTNVPTALNEDYLARHVQIYPNPAQTNFTVSLEKLPIQHARMAIYNSVGQCLGEQTIQNKAIFNVEHLPKGVYVVKIHTEMGVAIKRLSIR